VKAPDAFRTISEVAEALDLPQHVLRFWETRFTQIQPMKRGGGRRYYRPEDIDLLRGIRILLYSEGFTIRGVQRLLRENGVGFVAAVGQTGTAPPMTAAMRDEGPPEPIPSADEPAGDFDEDVFAFPPEDTGGTVWRVAEPSTPVHLDGAPRLGSAGQDGPGRPPLDDDARTLLQRALADLEEAQRLLDQVR
jgi:DNA-binding transcriptional MerR regulator